MTGVAFDKTVRRKPLRGCGGRGLWKFNRFSPERHCQKRDSARDVSSTGRRDEGGHQSINGRENVNLFVNPSAFTDRNPAS